MSHSWTGDDHWRAAALAAEDSLAQQLMQMQYRSDEEEDNADTPLTSAAEEDVERSASAPAMGRISHVDYRASALRSSIDQILQGHASPEDTQEFMCRRERLAVPAPRRPRKAEVIKPALKLGVSRVQGNGIAKKPSKRRVRLDDPHERARLADIAAARYAITTWEDVLRFKTKAAATKERHEAWDAKPAAWDLVLASSFSAMGTA